MHMDDSLCVCPAVFSLSPHLAYRELHVQYALAFPPICSLAPPLSYWPCARQTSNTRDFFHSVISLSRCGICRYLTLLSFTSSFTLDLADVYTVHSYLRSAAMCVCARARCMHAFARLCFKAKCLLSPPHLISSRFFGDQYVHVGGISLFRLVELKRSRFSHERHIYL